MGCAPQRVDAGDVLPTSRPLSTLLAATSLVLCAIAPAAHAGPSHAATATAAKAKKPATSAKKARARHGKVDRRLPKRWAARYHVRKAGADADHDGLSNLGEYRAKLNPRRPDTDRDGLRDGDEHAGRITALSPTGATIKLFGGGRLKASFDAATVFVCADDADGTDDGEDTGEADGTEAADEAAQEAADEAAEAAEEAADEDAGAPRLGADDGLEDVVDAVVAPVAAGSTSRLPGGTRLTIGGDPNASRLAAHAATAAAAPCAEMAVGDRVFEAATRGSGAASVFKRIDLVG